MATEQYKYTENRATCGSCEQKNIKEMNDEKISPALYEVPSTQMSSKEFQRMLYSWFEEKGLVADLRSYLRVLMIKRLKNTAVGKINQNKVQFSLPKQALCLVIAEHLLREGCHYTLSIFSTEVPGVANHLPFSLFEAHCSKENENWRFDQDSVLNILELLGIPKNDDESLRVAGLYSRNYGSLLACLITSKCADRAEVVGVEGRDREDIDHYLERVMSLVGVPSNVTEEIRKRIQDNVMRERQKNDTNTQRHYKKIIDDLKSHQLARDVQIKELLDDQVGLKKENRKLRNNLKETRKHLNQMILQEKSVKIKEEQLREEFQEFQRLKDTFARDKVKIKEVCSEKHCSDSCKKNLELAEHLQTEFLRLQQLDKDKTLEIELLNAKIRSLEKDLHGSQMKIDFLNSCLQRYNQINSQTGEEPHYSSDETSDNLTEEILKEVRSKLVELERESDELDVRFKKLKMK